MNSFSFQNYWSMVTYYSRHYILCNVPPISPQPIPNRNLSILDVLDPFTPPLQVNLLPYSSKSHNSRSSIVSENFHVLVEIRPSQFLPLRNLVILKLPPKHHGSSYSPLIAPNSFQKFFLSVSTMGLYTQVQNQVMMSSLFFNLHVNVNIPSPTQ